MRLGEFKRIKLKVTKNNIVIYEGTAEELPEEYKTLKINNITIKPETAEVEVEDLSSN